MRFRIEEKMEPLFGLCGIIFGGTLIIIAAFLTPGYSPLRNTISDLGYGIAKSLFSIGLVICGSLSIPFYIQLERELIDIKEIIRRAATAISIISCVSMALCGIIPDETYHDIFLNFHGLVAMVAFIGSSIYIGLYSILMYTGPKITTYTGPKFKRYHAIFGFVINAVLIVFIITNQPLIEWILAILMFIWIIMTAIQMISFKFFNISGLYYKQSEFPKALKLFEDALQILARLDMRDEPIRNTLQDNVEYLRNKLKGET